MLFDQVLNLLDYQLCPAQLETKILWKVEAIALAAVRNFKSPGIFAVEMFIHKNGDVFVNKRPPACTTVVTIPSRLITVPNLICFGELCLVIPWAIRMPYCLLSW